MIDGQARSGPEISNIFPHAHNTYHTNLIIAAKYGPLNETTKARIPTSTRASWKHRNTSHILGHGDDLTPPDLERMVRSFVFRKGFRNICRALYAVNEVLRSIVGGLRDRKKELKEHAGRIALVVDTFGKKVGKERILKWFGVPYQVTSRKQDPKWLQSINH